MVEKFNKIGEMNPHFDERYTHSIDPRKKYVYIKCAQKKCKFRAWFIKKEDGSIQFARASYISHCPDQHYLMKQHEEEEDKEKK